MRCAVCGAEDSSWAIVTIGTEEYAFCDSEALARWAMDNSMYNWTVETEETEGLGAPKMDIRNGRPENYKNRLPDPS